jgi:DNA (cytosine-5)-methyltransferase 1
MDTAKAITHVSLCAGYGGIDLGLKRAIPNLRTIAFSEIEAFACANLVAKMEAGCLDAAPIWTDVKTFPWASFHGKVDILSGGYPCQPFSAAGKRLGKDDPRHLWPWIADGIRAMQPGLCFFENVEGHISLGLREVIGELEAIGYRTTWGLFSAAEVGAPHQRKRVFILAHRADERFTSWTTERRSESDRERRSAFWDQPCGQSINREALAYRNGERGLLSDRGRHSSEQMPVSNGATGRNELAFAIQQGPQGSTSKPLHTGGLQSEIGRGCDVAWPSRPGQPQHEWEPPRVVGDADHGRQSSGIDAGSGAKAIGRGQGDVEQAESGQTEPAMGGDADGASRGLDHAELYITSDNRTDELRLLGNGVVPATAERAFCTLINRFP